MQVHSWRQIPSAAGNDWSHVRVCRMLAWPGCGRLYVSWCPVLTGGVRWAAASRGSTGRSACHHWISKKEDGVVVMVQCEEYKWAAAESSAGNWRQHGPGNSNICARTFWCGLCCWQGCMRTWSPRARRALLLCLAAVVPPLRLMLRIV